MLELRTFLPGPGVRRRIRHSRLFWRVLGTLLALELFAGLAWLLFLLRKQPGHLEYGIALLAAHVMAVVTFACGGRVEQQHAWFTRLARICEMRRPAYQELHEPATRLDPSPTSSPSPSREVAPLTSPEGMAAWRDVTRHELVDRLYATCFSSNPSTPTLQVLGHTVLDGGIGRTFLTFEATDGASIPAFLFCPSTTAPLPAALVVPGHGRGIVETAGLTASYQHGVALALARAGFVTLSPELRGFGYLGVRSGTDHISLARRALREGTFYYAVVLRDLRVALTVLSNDHHVDANRIAVTGCSLGGDLSLTLGALDPRVAAVVAQGLCNWRGQRGTWPAAEDDGSYLSHDVCSVVPGELANAHYEDRFLLMCPRPFAIINGRQDVGDMAEDRNWLLSLLRRAYRLEGVSDRFTFELAPGGHEYHLGPALAFLSRHFPVDRHLAGRADAPSSRVFSGISFPVVGDRSAT